MLTNFHNRAVGRTTNKYTIKSISVTHFSFYYNHNSRSVHTHTHVLKMTSCYSTKNAPESLGTWGKEMKEEKTRTEKKKINLH